VFGRYISECGDVCIQCPVLTANAISESLWPAYEDLFDGAEEYALDMLLTQWNDLCNSEDEEFQKVYIATYIYPLCNDGLLPFCLSWLLLSLNPEPAIIRRL
jgi:hypothetical protein